MIKLGLLQSFSNWRNERQEKFLNEMEESGKCPDCRGRGFTLPYSAYVAGYECPSCNGSGLFSDWEAFND